MANKFDKILMLKDGTPSNNYFEITSEINDYYILKRTDTIMPENTKIIALEKSYVEEHMYTASEFFQKADYIGLKGYYKNMTDFEKHIYQTFILIFKDEYNELLYDTISECIFIAPSLYDYKDFVACKDQDKNIKFKRMKFK